MAGCDKIGADVSALAGGGADPGHFRLLARFNAWVNARLFESVAALDEAAYRRDRGAFFGSLHGTLNHLLAVDRLWMGRIEGRDRGITALDQVLHDDRESLRRARRAEDAALVALVDDLDPARLATPIAFIWLDGGGEATLRVDLILVTLFNHQTHHRGQVHCLLTQAGLRPEPWDVMDYLAARPAGAADFAGPGLAEDAGGA